MSRTTVLLDARTPGEQRGEASVDERFAAAFREWGLDVDSTPLAEAVEMLKRRPAAVVTEIVAALDE